MELEVTWAPLANLSDLLGRSRALLHDVQAPWQAWALDWWIDHGDPGDAQLALDRAVAFGRQPTVDGAYWAITWQLRWHAIGADNDLDVRRAHAALARAAALRLADLTGASALRGLAADALLDLAVLDATGDAPGDAPRGELDLDRVRRARDEAEAAAPDAEAARLEAPASAWWRLVRARALANDRDGALEALGRLKASVEAGEAWSLGWVVTGEDPALPWLRRLPEVAAFLDAWASR